MTGADWVVVKRIARTTWKGLGAQLGVTEQAIRAWRRGDRDTPKVVAMAVVGLICQLSHDQEPISHRRLIEDVETAREKRQAQRHRLMARTALGGGRQQ